MIDLSNPLYQMSEKELASWPRYVTRADCVPWSDGVLYLQYRDERTVSAHDARQRVVWSASDGSYSSEMMFGRRQVSALAVMAICHKINKG